MACHSRIQAHLLHSAIALCARSACQACKCGNDLDVDEGEAADTVSVALAAGASWLVPGGVGSPCGKAADSAVPVP